MRQPDGGQRFRQRPDLVELDKDGVGGSFPDPPLKAADVGDKEVVAHDLDFIAESLCEFGPALPVLLIQRILQGDDGVVLNQFCPEIDQFIRGEPQAGLGQAIAALRLPFTGGGVDGQGDVAARLVPGFADGFQDQVQRLPLAGKIRREAALVAHRGGQAFALQQRLERLVHLRAPAQALVKGRSTHRHHHEFLYVQIVGRVLAAVEDVQHRDGQRHGLLSAQVAEQALLSAERGGLGIGQADSQDGVGAQFGLVGGAVQPDHRRVKLFLVLPVPARQFHCDLVIDVADGVGDPFAAKMALVAVAQFMRLKQAGRRPAGDRRNAGHAAVQGDDGLGGR